MQQAKSHEQANNEENVTTKDQKIKNNKKEVTGNNQKVTKL